MANHDKSTNNIRRVAEFIAASPNREIIKAWLELTVPRKEDLDAIMEKHKRPVQDVANLCSEDCSKEDCAWYVPESVGADDGEPVPGHCSTAHMVQLYERTMAFVDEQNKKPFPTRRPKQKERA